MLSEIQKCQLFCNWMGEGASKKAQAIKMQHKDDGTEHDRNELKHLLDAFGDCVIPLWSFIHNSQLIGNITSSMGTDQSEFLYKLCSVAKECKFLDSDDVIKPLFPIINKNAEVRSELLKEVKDPSTLDEYLDIAHRIESVAEAEKLANSTTSTTQSNVQLSGPRSQTRGWGRGAYFVAAIEVVFMAKVGVRDGLEVAVTPLTVMTIHVSTVVKQIHPSHLLLMV